MKIRSFIPNLFTLGNLFCGLLAILYVWKGNVYGVITCLTIALALDFFDGFVARLLQVSSPLGKELDSLADMVSFGVVPGMVMMRMVHEALGLEFEAAQLLEYEGFPWPIFAFLVPLFSALRLAKFNIDTRQSDAFYGLATPSSTVGLVSFWLILHLQPETWLAPYLTNAWILIGIICVFSWLLVAEIRLIAMKFKNYSWQDNKFRYLLMICAILLLAIFQYLAIPFIILLYIALSIVQNITES